MADYSSVFAEAVRYFWSIRADGAVDLAGAYAGRRSEVVAGNHCDGFFNAIADLLE